MQHQDLDFVFRAVAEFARLGPGAAQRNSQVAQVGRRRSGRERQDVGGVIQTAELAIQTAQIGVAGNEAIERLSLGDFFL